MISLARAFYYTGDYGQSLELSDRVLSGNPGNATALMTRALSLAGLKRKELAKVALDGYKTAIPDPSTYSYI